MHTRIPAITHYLNVKVKDLPLLQCGVQLAFVFLFEEPFLQNLFSTLASFFSVWTMIRLFNKVKDHPEVVGDSSPAFALSSFLPQRYEGFKGTVDSITDLVWRICNLCGLVGRLQHCFLPATPKPQPKEKKAEAKKNEDLDEEAAALKPEQQDKEGNNRDQKKRSLALDKLALEIKQKMESGHEKSEEDAFEIEFSKSQE